ncbi:MAG: hypothetical protein OSA49_06210, partial [Ascidiaceihabitans sp.]|nr:hypothetical protein [Ascidiaceihabitans sp.]
RRPVSDVCHRAAAACPAPRSNTTAGRTNKSTKVCVWACRTKISSTIAVSNTLIPTAVFNTAIKP